MVKLVILVCSLRLRFVAHFLVGHDSDIIYRVVRKARSLHYGDATDYMLKLI